MLGFNLSIGLADNGYIIYVGSKTIICNTKEELVSRVTEWMNINEEEKSKQ